MSAVSENNILISSKGSVCKKLAVMARPTIQSVDRNASKLLTELKKKQYFENFSPEKYLNHC